MTVKARQPFTECPPGNYPHPSTRPPACAAGAAQGCQAGQERGHGGTRVPPAGPDEAGAGGPLGGGAGAEPRDHLHRQGGAAHRAAIPAGWVGGAAGGMGGAGWQHFCPVWVKPGAAGQPPTPCRHGAGMPYVQPAPKPLLRLPPWLACPPVWPPAAPSPCRCLPPRCGDAQAGGG